MIFREGVETVLMLSAWFVLTLRASSKALGAILGIGLAVLFGVSFVRGTIRVNLKQFFQMTTAILMVVVVQLAITGLHELSESQILPASSRGDGDHRARRQERHFLLHYDPRPGRGHDAARMAQAARTPHGRARRRGTAQSALVGAARTPVDDRILHGILRFHSPDHGRIYLRAPVNSSLAAVPVTLDNGAVRIPSPR